MKMETCRLRGQAGFTLVELMIAMLLGLIVVGAAGSVFLSSQKTYKTTEEMARLQEGGRAAFELMAKDIREAGASPCPGITQVLNIVTDDPDKVDNSQAQLDPANFGAHTGIIGDQNKITLLNGMNDNAAISPDYNLQSGQFETSEQPEVALEGKVDVKSGDLVVVCDPASATQFIATGASTTVKDGNETTAIQFKSSRNGFLIDTSTNQPCEVEGGTCTKHYNISKCLGPLGADRNGHCTYKYGCERGALPPDLAAVCYTGSTDKKVNLNICENNKANSGGCPVGFEEWPAYLVKFYSVSWFVEDSTATGADGNKRKALYRQVAGQAKQEIALGVQSVRFGYLMKGETQYASAPSGSTPVVGVKVVLTLDTESGAGEGGELARIVEFTVAPRNFAG